MEELVKIESTVITYTDYKKYKAELDAELQKSAESFIRIGYLLKVARDTGILRESGYENVNDFAQKEYDLDKTQVSRFININDRFSEDGYSERLKTEYRGFGYAKLALMLRLPESITEELSPEYSKSEIQAIKDEFDEESKVTDIEVMIEEKDQRQQALDSTLQQATWQIGKDMPELYVELWESLMEKQESEKAFVERLAPSGLKTYMARIPGKGRVMLMIKEEGEEIKLINLRDENDKKTYSKAELVEAFRSQFIEAGDAETSWSSNYGEDFPEKIEEVAPVQPRSATPKPAQRKESKVTKAKPVKKPEKDAVQQSNPPESPVQVQQSEPEEMTLHDVDAAIPTPQPVEQESELQPEAQDEPAEEQQVEGQTEITKDFPEILPEPVPEETHQPLPEQSFDELQKRAFELTKYTLSGSLEVWNGKHMPLEAILRNKQHAENLVKIFVDMETWTRAGEAEDEETNSEKS